jgi:hypothetical protein
MASQNDLQTSTEKVVATNGAACFRYAPIKQTVFESTSYGYIHKLRFLVEKGEAAGLLLFGFGLWCLGSSLGRGRGSAALGSGGGCSGGSGTSGGNGRQLGLSCIDCWT